MNIYLLIHETILVAPDLYVPPLWKGGGGWGHTVFSADPVGLFALCLLIEWTDFGQTYTNISLGGGGGVRKC